MIDIVYSSNLKKESDNKKIKNIESFSSLDRTNLSFESHERRLLIKEYSTGEKLYIQYPGKETLARGTRSARPWDFRPKLQLADGSWLGDLSFKDVWDDLYEFKDCGIDLSYIATLYFRIAYMADTTLERKSLPYTDFDADGNVIGSGELELEWYAYCPEEEIINGIQVPKEALKGCSLLPYLAYNDLLAQNEDCKYYYRSVYEKNENWKTDTGRRNTLLTHMSVIAFIEGLLKFTEITDMFQRGMGVAALSSKLWSDTTHGRVTK